MVEKKGYLYVLLAAVLWGTTGTATTFISSTVNPVIIAMLRLFTGGMITLLFLLSTKKLKIKGVSIKAILAIALLMALFQFSFFTAVRLTGVAIGTVVSIGSAPIFAGVLEALFLKRIPSKKWFVATTLSVIGCSLLVFNKNLLIFSWLGVIFALLAGVLFATYAFVNRAIVKKIGAMNAVAIVFIISAVLLSPSLFIFDVSSALTPRNIIVILYIGIVTSSLGYILFLEGLKSIPPSSATMLALAEPLTAAFLSVFIVKEYLSFSAWIGVGLLIFGIITLSVNVKAQFLKRSYIDL